MLSHTCTFKFLGGKLYSSLFSYVLFFVFLMEVWYANRAIVVVVHVLYTYCVTHTRFNQIFGAMLSCTLRISEHFYGSGESFLFSFSEPSKINVFSWTGENDYFVKGNKDSIGIGSGE